MVVILLRRSTAPTASNEEVPTTDDDDDIELAQKRFDDNFTVEIVNEKHATAEKILSVSTQTSMLTEAKLSLIAEKRVDYSIIVARNSIMKLL